MESKAPRAGSARRPPGIMRNFFDPLTVLLVGPMSGLASPDASDEELQKVAAVHPVFRLR